MRSIDFFKHRRFAPLILFVASWTGVSSVHATPVLWSGNNNLYEVILSNQISFTAARSSALGLGAGWDLASITSQAEQDFIVSLLPTSPTNRDHYWLGGSDAVTEGSWEWLDGEVWSYTSWWGGEPNNLNGEDSLAMDFRTGGGWNWNDISFANSGSLVRGYIVEKVATSVPEPTALALISLGLFGLGFSRRKKLQ